jgi:hypothetical protein
MDGTSSKKQLGFYLQDSTATGCQEPPWKLCMLDVVPKSPVVSRVTNLRFDQQSPEDDNVNVFRAIVKLPRLYTPSIGIEEIGHLI